LLITTGVAERNLGPVEHLARALAGLADFAVVRSYLTVPNRDMISFDVSSDCSPPAAASVAQLLRHLRSA